MSLMNVLRTNVLNFVQNKYVDNAVLGMTILLCVVIFTELAIEEQINANPVMVIFFYYLNFFMLTFFIVEIVLKLFA